MPRKLADVCMAKQTDGKAADGTDEDCICDKIEEAAAEEPSVNLAPARKHTHGRFQTMTSFLCTAPICKQLAENVEHAESCMQTLRAEVVEGTKTGLRCTFVPYTSNIVPVCADLLLKSEFAATHNPLVGDAPQELTCAGRNLLSGCVCNHGPNLVSPYCCESEIDRLNLCSVRTLRHAFLAVEQARE
jgi:hypothetical protein